MQQVLSGQISGLAKMISDFADHAATSAASLRELLRKEHSDTEQHSQTSMVLADDVSRIILEPLSVYISKTKTLLNQYSKMKILDEAGELEDSISPTHSDLNSKIDSIEGYITEIQLHFSTEDKLQSEPTSTLAGLLNDIEDAIGGLRIASSDLVRHATDLPTAHSLAAPFGTASPDILKSVLATFTMDAERSDYYSALHKLGIKP